MGKIERIEINADRLIDKLNESKMTQRELCSLIDVNPQSFNRRIHSGKLSSNELSAICAILDCDTEYIVGNTDSDYGYRQHNKPAGYDTPEELLNALHSIDEQIKSAPSGVMMRTRNADGTEDIIISGHSIGEIAAALFCDPNIDIDSILQTAIHYRGIKPLYSAIKTALTK